MDKVLFGNISELKVERKISHGDYEFTRHCIVGAEDSSCCRVARYELPPLKSSFPYHYHVRNEEFYLILSGEGVVRTPQGEHKVGSGDFVYFPANADGAHKITNTSKSENLVYIDFDTQNSLEVAIYPDSNKVGIWGMGINKVFRQEDSVDYYDGEQDKKEC